MAYLEFKHNPDHNLRHTPNKLGDMSGSLHVSLTRRAEGSAPRGCRPGRRSKMPKLTLFGSHPDGKARCDNCRRVAGSLRQDGPGCAENDPSGAPLNEILKSVARRAPAYEDAAQTIGGRNTHGDKSGRG